MIYCFNIESNITGKDHSRLKSATQTADTDAGTASSAINVSSSPRAILPCFVMILKLTSSESLFASRTDESIPSEFFVVIIAGNSSVSAFC